MAYPAGARSHFMSTIVSPDKDLALALSSHIMRSIPKEKVQVTLRQAKIARAMQAAGSVQLAAGVGQRMTVMDPRLYFRLQQTYGHHEGWVDDMLKDNPELCAPGYKPGRKGDFRHGITFVGGKPTGYGPHSEKRMGNSVRT